MIPTGTGFNKEQEEMLRIDSSERYVSVDVSVSDFTCSYNNITGPCRAIAVSVTGNVVTKNSLGTNVTHYCVAGAMYPIATRTIVNSGTTATGIVAYF